MGRSNAVLGLRKLEHEVEMEEMQRLLCLLSGMNAGGAETFLMKIYRNIDRDKYQFDFCINMKEKCFYEDEILSLGGRIYRIPSKSENVKEFKRRLFDIVNTERYQYVLRITSSAMGFMDLKIAKTAGAKVCCARSSNSSDGGSIKSIIAHKIGRMFYGRYVDKAFAPSDLAAAYTFGKRKDVTILHNAIDTTLFHYSEDGRKQIREEFGFTEDDIVLGHVGRFTKQKNHAFLLDVFARIHDKNSRYKLLLIGQGELENDLREKISCLHINNAVIFGGIRKDIPEIMSAMDVFVFPSLYEGMPNTVIEAQATGLTCIIADTITKEADITGLVDYLPIDKVDCWVERLEEPLRHPRMNTLQAFKKAQYDIDSQAQLFTKIVFDEGE